METTVFKNRFEIILETINGGIFRQSRSIRKVTEYMSGIYRDIYDIDISDCTRYECNLFGNLDAIFIYGKVSGSDKIFFDMIEIAGKVCAVIFVDNLLLYLNRLKKSDTYQYIYKFDYGRYDDSKIGYAKDFTKSDVVGGMVCVKKEDTENEEFEGYFPYPSNYKYLIRLCTIFDGIISVIQPNFKYDTTMKQVYRTMSFVLAIYSHMLTIGYVVEEDIENLDGDAEFLKFVQGSDFKSLITGSYLKYLSQMGYFKDNNVSGYTGWAL